MSTRSGTKRTLRSSGREPVASAESAEETSSSPRRSTRAIKRTAVVLEAIAAEAEHAVVRQHGRTKQESISKPETPVAPKRQRTSSSSTPAAKVARTSPPAVEKGEEVEYVDEHGHTHRLRPGEQVILADNQDQYDEPYQEVVVMPEPESGGGNEAGEARLPPHYQESMGTMLESLFYSKLNIYERTFTTSSADVAVNICSPDITDGFMFFDEIHALAGPRLIRDCKTYVGMQHGSCRVTRSYNASNYKCIIHTALPHLPNTSRIVDVEIAQMAIKRCLNEALSRGAQTIAFPSFFPCFSPLIGTEFVLKVISNWMYLTDQKGQLGKLREVQVLCHSPTVFRLYKGMINKLYADLMDIAAKHGVENTTLFDVYGVVFKRNRQYYSPVRYETYPLTHPVHPDDHPYAPVYDEGYERTRRRRRNRDPDVEAPPPEQQVRLELSAKLQPSVLVLDDKDGMKRQYRLTNKSKDGRKLYFRCSFCDTLIRKTNLRIRAKITLQDGEIVGERYPKHHPDCKAKSAEDLMVQQIDRKSRREVKDGILQPREAYEKARQLALQIQHQMRAGSVHHLDPSMVLEEEEQQLHDATTLDESDVTERKPFEDAEDEHAHHAPRRLHHTPQQQQQHQQQQHHHQSQFMELPNFPEWQRIRQQYFRMRKVGEIQKHNQMQVRTDALRQATFIENDDDETMLVEVDDPDAVHVHEEMVDVEIPEPRRGPRILVHHHRQDQQPQSNSEAPAVSS